MDDLFGDIEEGEDTKEGGPKLAVPQATPKELSKSIMRVFFQLGGDSWLYEQAKSEPLEFLHMLKSVVPREQPQKHDEAITVEIIDSIGEEEYDKGLPPQAMEPRGVLAEIQQPNSPEEDFSDFIKDLEIEIEDEA